MLLSASSEEALPGKDFSVANDTLLTIDFLRRMFPRLDCNISVDPDSDIVKIHHAGILHLDVTYKDGSNRTFTYTHDGAIQISMEERAIFAEQKLCMGAIALETIADIANGVVSAIHTVEADYNYRVISDDGRKEVIRSMLAPSFLPPPTWQIA